MMNGSQGRDEMVKGLGCEQSWFTDMFYETQTNWTAIGLMSVLLSLYIKVLNNNFIIADV